MEDFECISMLLSSASTQQSQKGFFSLWGINPIVYLSNFRVNSCGTGKMPALFLFVCTLQINISKLNIARAIWTKEKLIQAFLGCFLWVTWTFSMQLKLHSFTLNNCVNINSKSFVTRMVQYQTCVEIVGIFFHYVIVYPSSTRTLLRTDCLTPIHYQYGK